MDGTEVGAEPRAAEDRRITLPQSDYVAPDVYTKATFEWQRAAR